MNLYEFEGKELFKKYGIATPCGVVVRRGDDFPAKYNELGIKDVVIKAQVLSGKRGKNNGIRFCGNADEAKQACEDLFNIQIRGQYVAAVLIEEKLNISEEHYVSIVYDTNKKQPVLIYSKQGGMDIEDVPEDRIDKVWLDVRVKGIASSSRPVGTPRNDDTEPVQKALWECFLAEDARVAEINPFVKTADGQWVAADAKVALDDDAFYRHPSTSLGVNSISSEYMSGADWTKFEPRTMLGRPPTEREVAVKKIDEGEGYYRGTAGKYIEMDGDIAILFSGGGASIANMDALIKAGLKPANYTEYSGNPPREKVYALAKIVLSKPNLRGLWIAGGVANFTNVGETFQGIADALDEIKPAYPIVIRRAGPFEKEGMELMQECAARNNLNMKIFGKEMPMSESAIILAQMVK